MSEQSKRARQERRAGERGPDIVVQSEHAGSYALEPEPTVRMFGLMAVPGQGTVYCEADVPRSALEVKSAPDILPITLAKLDDAISAHASKGVAG